MTTFAEGRERTKALGIWSAIAAGGGAVGLILGGLLTETLSWRWIFFVQPPHRHRSCAAVHCGSSRTRGARRSRRAQTSPARSP